jgi:hypothetical protein
MRECLMRKTTRKRRWWLRWVWSRTRELGQRHNTLPNRKVAVRYSRNTYREKKIENREKVEWMEHAKERKGRMKKDGEASSTFSKPNFIKTCSSKILQISLFRILLMKDRDVA